MSHSSCRRRNRVDSRLLVVGNQIASLTLGPSFAHNLGCRCPNGSCETILDIYTSRPFQRYKKHQQARCFSFCCRTLKLRESWRTPSSHFWEYESHPHICPKWGCDNRENLDHMTLIKCDYLAHFSIKKLYSLGPMQFLPLDSHLGQWKSYSWCM